MLTPRSEASWRTEGSCASAASARCATRARTCSTICWYFGVGLVASSEMTGGAVDDWPRANMTPIAFLTNHLHNCYSAYITLSQVASRSHQRPLLSCARYNEEPRRHHEGSKAA